MKGNVVQLYKGNLEGCKIINYKEKYGECLRGTDFMQDFNRRDFEIILDESLGEKLKLDLVGLTIDSFKSLDLRLEKAIGDNIKVFSGIGFGKKAYDVRSYITQLDKTHYLVSILCESKKVEIKVNDIDKVEKEEALAV